MESEEKSERGKGGEGVFDGGSVEMDRSSGGDGECDDDGTAEEARDAADDVDAVVENRGKDEASEGHDDGSAGGEDGAGLFGDALPALSDLYLVALMAGHSNLGNVECGLAL